MSPESIYFIAGLPRTGSTLLCNILYQNPRFHATSTSGLAEVMRGIKDGWQRVDAFRAQSNDEMYLKLRQTLRAVLFGYYADVDRPVVFDKSRAWPRYIEMLEQTLGEPPKLLVTVRNLADVMASWELRWRETQGLGFIPIPEGVRTDILEGRVNFYRMTNHPIGAAFDTLKDAFARGHRDKMHIVDFDALTRTPKMTMMGIYEFLGEEPFEHDFGYVEQVTHEDDREFGFIGLHTIRTKVEPIPSRWQVVLGTLGEGIAKQKCW